MTLREQIAEASAKATQGVWEVQDGCSWRRIGTRRHDGNVLCPVTARYDNHPDLSCGAGEDVYANLQLMVMLVNAYRAGKIIVIEDDAEAVRRMVEAIAPEVFACPRINLNKPAYDKAHERATAALATLKGDKP